MIENVLNQLSKVKSTGTNKWVARCPAHEDGSPSLAIKDDAGKVLLHCFAGCSVPEIMDAIGLPIGELFPPSDWKPDEKGLYIGTARFTAMDALRCLQQEGAILAILAADMADGKVLSPDERDRVTVAAGRIATAVSYLEQ